MSERYDQAIADFTRAIELDPSNAVIMAARGETCRLSGRYDQAAVDFARAIVLDPNIADELDADIADAVPRVTGDIPGQQLPHAG